MTDVKLWLLHSNTWNHLTVYKNIYIYIYIHEQDLALNNLQSLTGLKTKANQIWIIISVRQFINFSFLSLEI